MKSITTKNILLTVLLLLGLTSYSFAAADLPVTTQVSDKVDGKIEIHEEIKIEAQSATPSSNPKLKEGKACLDENLEEAKGKTFTEIPMAETMPCDTVDCSDLGAAQLHKDNYVKLKNAKTISCDK
ncbi:MAG: Unknown protein [uncultured Sulfurovum sp.]|uniref:Secreted protein n=1 Tax=uncultured Sulfurovum sp. TaxID=269237 RepID=A0A6S6SMX1_9BACT|nr:MAG: Unknown protein [uncultured Sulfurovum sp.]